MLETVQSHVDEDPPTVPLGQGPFLPDAPYVDESAWEEDSVDEYLNSDALEPAEPSAPSYSRPTFEGPLTGGSAFAKPAASVPAYLKEYPGHNPLRRSSHPPAPLPPLPSRYVVSPQRAEMPTPVMEIFPSLDAIRPESRPPPPPHGHPAHIVTIPPAPPLPRAMSAQPVRVAPPPFPARPNLHRTDSRLDTLRPYAASTATSSVSESGPSLLGATSVFSSMRPWVATAGEHLEDFLEYSGGALRDLRASAAKAWTSRKEPVRETESLASRYLTAKTAAWVLGLASVALLVANVRSPRVSSVEAAQGPAPLLVDADAIEPKLSADSPDEEDRSEEGAESNDRAESAPDPDEAKSDKAPLLARARAGDRVAVSELNRREPTSLSVDEVQALAVGEEKISQQTTTQEVLAIAEKRRLTSDDIATFLRHVENPRTYREALLAMAENRSWQGPDLIYLAMRRYRSQEHVEDFALSLLLTPRIYKYASPALTVVIDAESMSAEPTSTWECFHIRQLVDRAYEDGDRRAVPHMARFASTTGCGEDSTEDCFPCLRNDTALSDALRAAKTRRPPF